MNNISSLESFCRGKGMAFTPAAPLSERCTFKTGGEAAMLIEPASVDEISELAVFLRENGLEYIILGRGSNVLFPDEGLDLAVIALGEMFSKIELDGEDIYCQSGLSLTQLCRFACENSLSGLEFAYGIPGTVGGAVYMNAGAYGGEIKDVLERAGHIGSDGKQGRLSGDRLELSYRRSAYTGSDMIITDAHFRLKKGSRDEIRAKMEDFMSRRREKQPLEYPSAGSTFKRPEGAYASELIDRCGLKGMSVGAAQVSEKHAGFVINRGGASSNDIFTLMKAVRDEVKAKTGFVLEPEIRIYGELTWI